MSQRSLSDAVMEGYEALRQTSVLLFAAVPPASLSAMVIIAALTFDASATLRYFELVAQIIPVFVLALVIEQRYFFQSRPPRVVRFSVIVWPFPRKVEGSAAAFLYAFQAVTLLTIIGGETAALWAVAERNPTSLAFALATGGLVAAISALIVSSLATGIDSWLKDFTHSDSHSEPARDVEVSDSDDTGSGK